MSGILNRGVAIASALAVAAGWITPLAGTAVAVGGWQVETVDQNGTGRFSSLRIDKDGNAHVAFVVDDPKYTLKYGFWDHAIKRWFVMPVDEGASFCSLTLDSKHRPHISYTDYGTMSGSKLRYAYWDGASWIKQAVPLNADIISFYTSIVLDANDNPTISFYEYTGPRGTDFRVRLRTVTKNASYWQVGTVDGQNQSGKFNALAIDAQGHMHLAYANVNSLTAGMRYAYWDGTSWNLEILDGHEQNNQENVGYSVCIALDREGNPHLSYSNYTNPAVKYAVRKNGQWQTQIVDRVSGVAYPDRNSIAIDDDGTPYIGYYDAGQGVLKLAHKEGQNWIGEIVDRNAAGATSSLQIDHGTIWISYADEGAGGLKVARRDLKGRDSAGTSAAVKPRKPIK